MKIAPKFEDHLGDIQALLGSGFPWLTSSRFYLLTIKNSQVDAAKEWLRTLKNNGLLQSISDLTDYIQVEKDAVTKDNAKTKPAELCAIAFSYAGLQKLGIEESVDFPFPTPFRSGMGSELRENLLRDSPRAQWKWGDTDVDHCDTKRDSVHILLCHWWDDGRLPQLKASKFPTLKATTFGIRCVNGCPSFFMGKKLYEPFGFRDGLSQPVLYDLNNTSPKGKGNRDQITATGEIILGYRNEYNELGYCADAKGWRDQGVTSQSVGAFTLNGSYLAVRQIEQDVEKFEPFTKCQLPYPPCPANVTQAEKIIGRRRDGYGTPLDWAGTGCPISDEEANKFRYRVNDTEGFFTPLGSHIRRANPRDSLGHDVESGLFSAKLHRLLRRGRPYRETKPLNKDACGEATKETQGMFFIACNADLERQFEFVYQRWIQNPRFNDLDAENDPLLGEKNENMTIQGLPSGTKLSLEKFTTTLGGGYFFLPGLKALAFIADKKN
jgi:porphyrinogen peroxidase